MSKCLTQVTASGHGIDPTVSLNEPVEFIIDTSRAGKAPLGVSVTDGDRKPIEVTVKDNKDGTYLCRYVPVDAIKHVVVVTYGGVIIPRFPVGVGLDLKDIVLYSTRVCGREV